MLQQSPCWVTTLKNGKQGWEEILAHPGSNSIIHNSQKAEQPSPRQWVADGQNVACLHSGTWSGHRGRHPEVCCSAGAPRQDAQGTGQTPCGTPQP